MYLSATEVDWDKPIVWINPFKSDKRSDIAIMQARCVSRNMNDATKKIGVIVTLEGGTEEIYKCDVKGRLAFSASNTDQRAVWNYVENIIDTYETKVEENVEEMGSL